MSRELKFRMWDKVNNKFINPFRFEWNNYYKDTGMVVLDFHGKIRIADYSSGNGDNSADSVYSEVDNPDNYVVQQYTGCHDSANKEIYEGDIVKYNNGDVILIGYIEFMAGIFFLNFPDQTDEELGYLLVSNLKVIGNKFETPELLK